MAQWAWIIEWLFRAHTGGDEADRRAWGQTEGHVEVMLKSLNFILWVLGF